MEKELRDTKALLNQTRQQLIMAQSQILQYQMQALKAEEKEFVIGELDLGSIVDGAQE